MKIAVVAVIGLAVGVGGGTAMSALQVKGEIMEARAQAAADSAAAGLGGAAAGHGDDGGVAMVLPPSVAGAEAPLDSTAHDATPPVEDTAQHADEDTAQHADEGPGSPEETTQVADAGTAQDSTTTPEATDTSQVVVTTAAAAPVVDSAAQEPPPVLLDPEGAKKLAKIFGAMKAADAAAVLAEMTDEEIEAVLRQMSDRLAAPILVNFPAERAANLSRDVLRNRGGR